MTKIVALRRLVWLAAIALFALGAWLLTGRPASSQQVPRRIAFDNSYGATSLPVYVRVDGGPETALSATCDTTTCSFEVPLTNGSHTLSIAVEQYGRRGAPSLTPVDTSSMRD